MRTRYGYDLRPGHPLGARLGQAPAVQPDPSGSVLRAYYGPPYTRFFPLLRPSGALGHVSQATAGRTGAEQVTDAGGGAAIDAYGTPVVPQHLADQMPWLFAPLDAFPFVLIPAAPLGGLANGSSAIVLAMPQLPRGQMAVLKRFGNNASVLAGVAWSFLVRNQPTSPINNFPSQYGGMIDARPLPEPGVILHSGDDFQLQVTNTSGGILNQITAIVIGYQWVVTG